MKRTVFLLLACLTVSPFLTKSQNEGIKPVANPAPKHSASEYSGTTQKMSTIQEQGTTGGAPCSKGLSGADTACYLEPGWTLGKVFLSDKSLLENIMLRYDIYDQQLQFIRDDDTLAFAKPDEVKGFVIDNRNFIYSDYENENVIAQGYFEVLSLGDCKLLARRTVKYHVAPDATSNIKEDLYIRECSYYLSKNGEMAKPVRASRKSVLCAFKDKAEQVERYMNDNNMKMNTCNDLKEVVDYYNSLQ
jgi:hypothetical protein